MREIIECIPNFSTSNPAVVEAILDEIRSVEDVYLLDHTYDSYYNRLVVSYVGNKNSAFKAALNSAVKAIELIDMNRHKGQHPRIGAVDVVPFIPIRNVAIEDCVDLAKKF
ncbi:MAG: glutamate formiminotransferase, partial [Candidatus Bathyarchaeota archaeon]|nr:glutamate formiminotransferase [Candidatus Bathyarchaeota archaeon]